MQYYAQMYAPMRRAIVPHEQYIDETTVEDLRHMTFVFLSLDNAETKKMIVARLEAWSIPFIDVGIGLTLVDGFLHGLVRVTTSVPGQREHVHKHGRIPFAAPNVANEYAQNIQVADLNGLNAMLAVLRWKKWAGFYADTEQEHHSVFAISGNALLNEDLA